MPEMLHVLSLNIRMDPDSGNPVPIPPNGAIPPQKRGRWFPRDAYAELPWAERRSRLVDGILSTGPLDIIGFQLLDLKELLGPAYDHVAVGRDDGKDAGEAVAIFWDESRFKSVRSKTIWLSPTPEVVGSKGWDAALPRIATFLTLSTRGGYPSTPFIHIVNTHFDHLGVKARAESSLLIREHIKKWVDEFDESEASVESSHSSDPAPVILMGDFTREEGYKNITSFEPLPSGTSSFTFLDSYTHLDTRDTDSKSKVSRQSRPYGPTNTYTDFKGPGRGLTERIDFVMLASAHDTKSAIGDESESTDKSAARGGWQVVTYGCIDNWVEEGDVDGWAGRWSDHRAVRVTVAKSS